MPDRCGAYHLRWAIIFVFSSSPSDWIAYMVAHLSKEELEIFFTIYWALWWNRNRTLMERITLPPVELLTFALNYINSFRQVNALPACIARRTAPSSWTPPDTGWIKLNCDGAIFAAESEIGLGVVARDERGSCVGWKALLEGDCSNLHVKLTSCQEDYSAIEMILRDIKALATGFEGCVFSLVRRTGNKVAHSLARNASSVESGDPILPPQSLTLMFSDILLL
ncbi:UNVERIFIED_CONTAM: hypothetical protein Slati_1318800 [Sesamum latifolium]|uniref:RNase H type-1 domain-containing protein n=1 Tax=Sesamum latifolium TaxID=2727402 RepID=A0AAW2XKK3_9LAMI